MTVGSHAIGSEPIGGGGWGQTPWSGPPGRDGTVARPLLLLYEGISEELIRRLRENPDLLHELTPEQFERLVAGRFERMGYSVQLSGRTNARDGGIDFVATPRSTAEFRFLIAGQVKHHRRPDRKTGAEAVDRLLAWKAKGAPFHLGCLVTNTDFTRDARWTADQNLDRFVRLRDRDDVTRWLNDNFAPNEEGSSEAPSEIALTRGVTIQLPPSFYGTSVEVWPTPREE